MISQHREYMLDRVELVADVIDVWLRGESMQADDGNNRYLRELETTQPYLQVGFYEPGNVLSAKTAGHHARLPFFLKGFVENPDDDYATGRITLAALMFTSGGYRWESLLRSADSSVYRELRESQGTSIDIVQTVRNTYHAQSAKVQTPQQRLAKFVTYASYINDKVLELDKAAIKWANDNALPASETSEAVVAEKEVQRLGIILAATQISIAAEQRDSTLSDVPLLEPKSITVAELYYPFRR